MLGGGPRIPGGSPMVGSGLPGGSRGPVFVFRILSRFGSRFWVQKGYILESQNGHFWPPKSLTKIMPEFDAEKSDFKAIVCMNLHGRMCEKCSNYYTKLTFRKFRPTMNS